MLDDLFNDTSIFIWYQEHLCVTMASFMFASFEFN